MAGNKLERAVRAIEEATGLDLPDLAVKGAKAARSDVKRTPDLPKAAPKPSKIPLAAKDGNKRIPGAPADIKTKRQEAKRRDEYRNTVEKGVQGALWYDDSGNAIMSHVGEDKDMARKVAGNFAVTSAGTGVKPNTGFTVKGHNQAISGDPVVTGRFPVAMGRNIEDVYKASGSATGLKRGPFEQQLAIGGGFAEPGTDPRAVHDVWDGRAWGYTNSDGSPFSGSFSPAQHRWQDEQLQKVIPTLSQQDFPWTTGRVQAAGWSGEKIKAGEISPDEAAYSYADDLPRHYGQGSRETILGSNTGIMPELLDADYALRQELDDRISPIIYDDKGRDRIALGYGALTGPSFKGPGIYEGINPGTQAQYAVGVDRIKPGMETEDIPVGKAIDPSSMNLMKAIEGTYGMLTGQKGIAGNKFFSDVPAGSRNAFQVTMGGPIDNDRAARLLELQARLGIAPDALAVVPSPEGVLVRNFGATPEAFGELGAVLSKELGTGKPQGGFFHGMYEENPWDTPEGRYGQSYLDLISTRPAYQEAFDRVAPDIAERLRGTYKEFSRDNHMTMPEYYDELLAAIAGGGEAGLRDLIKRRRFAEGGLVEDQLVSDAMHLAEKYGAA